MQRFFIQTILLWNNEIILQDEEIIYQLIKVLRSKINDEVIFFDGINFIDFKYKIISIDKKNIIFSFIEKIEKQKENYKIVLFQSLPNKIDKIEEIIQKWTEIGTNEFIFFKAERSQDLKISENKIQRLNKIIKEACEQSGRNIIPELNFLSKLDLDKISWENLYFHTDEKKSKFLKDLDFKSNDINIFVWPEWGFTENEIKKFEDSWFQKIYLWNNILRTQTTWVVVGFFILQRN